jgi:hypothetical protein
MELIEHRAVDQRIKAFREENCLSGFFAIPLEYTITG